MGVEVRTITEDELEAWGTSMARGFMRVSPAEGDHEFRRGHTELDRAWAAFDGTSVVGTLRSFPTPLTLPGGTSVTSAALTAVTVTATHRRQGLLTRMITGDLDSSVDKGEPVGILIAAEFPIYGRFGYGSAADHNIQQYMVLPDSSYCCQRDLLWSGFNSVVNLVLMGILLDAIAQWLILGASYPGAALLIGPTLITLPYVLARALANRVVRLAGY